MRAPGPLRAFGQRVRFRRGAPIATVAIARKLTTLAWHTLTKKQDYFYERPAPTFRKLRCLEFTVGAAPHSNPGGRHGPDTPDNPPRSDRSRPQARVATGWPIRRSLPRSPGRDGRGPVR